ncbi:MAG TPA: DNA-binding response regulator, partial [Myxococcales bacterium]|nr:DNA-binding response regulator [Myxococcales bacterium]
ERYVEAIHALHGGGRVLPPELEALLDAPAAKAPSELLTPREMQVFERLVMGETIKEAAFSLGLSVSTVYTYSDRIRTKLGVRTQPELVRYAASWDLDQR